MLPSGPRLERREMSSEPTRNFLAHVSHQVEDREVTSDADIVNHYR
jgi:hypothetical protein